MERGEVHGVGPLDDRNHEPAAAVLPLHVHGQAQGDALGGNPVRRAGLDRERVPHDGMLLGGLDQRERDEMGERDLPGFAPDWRRWLKPPPVCSIVPTGSTRKVVAVGTVRLSLMLATSLAAGP